VHEVALRLLNILSGFCTEVNESEIRELDPTGGVGSLIGSVEPGTRRVLDELPFVPLVVGGGILGCTFSIVLLDNRKHTT
jgi:hypothetical protein